MNNSSNNITSIEVTQQKTIERNIFMVFSVLTTLCIFCGNCLVVAAVATTRRLQTVTNMYVVSLAVADLLVAVLVLPPSIVYIYTDKWVFNSEISCIAWLSADILLCTASIYNLIVISIDRYMAVTSPLKYIAQRTKTRAVIMIVFAWAFSFFLVLPPLLGLKEHNAGNGTCEITNDKLFRFISSSSTFYIPFIIMVYLYTRIFIVSYRRLSMMKKNFPDFVVATSTGISYNNNNNTTNNHSSNSTRFNTSSLTSSTTEGESQDTYQKVRSSSSVSLANEKKKRSQRSNGFLLLPKFLLLPRLIRRRKSIDDDIGKIIKVPHKKCKRNLKYLRKKDQTKDVKRAKPMMFIGGECMNFLEEPEPVSKTKLCNIQLFTLDNENNMQQDQTDGATEMNYRTQTRQSLTQESSKVFTIPRKKSGFGKDEKSKERAAFQRENKTAITLAYVVGCFSLCWFPFFICYIAEPYINVELPKLLVTSITWLGYINSVFNPFIYAFYNKEYANAFKNFLPSC